MILKGWDRTRSSHISFGRRRKLRQNSVRSKQNINPRDRGYIVAHCTAILGVHFALLFSLFLHFLFFFFHKNLFIKKRNRTEETGRVINNKESNTRPVFCPPVHRALEETFELMHISKIDSAAVFMDWQRDS
jgi:hypothetical protein